MRIRRSNRGTIARYVAMTADAAKTDVTTDARYNAFCEAVMANDGSVNVGYVSGLNHGARNDNAISTAQLVGGSGVMAIDGDYASGGVATVPNACDIFIYSTDNESGLTVLIQGTDANNLAQTISVPGPQRTDSSAANYRRTYTGLLWLSITSITWSGAPAGEVSAGIRETPSDYKGARIAGNEITLSTLSEGINSGRRHYYTTNGRCRDGTLIHIFNRYDSESDVGTTYRIISTDNGLTWSNPQAVTVSGLGTLTSPTSFYTPILPLRDSDTVVSCLQKFGTIYSVTSTDKGLTWTGVKIANPPSITLTNIETINVGAKRFGLVSTAGNLVSQYTSGDLIGASSAGSNNGVYSVASASYGVDPADSVTRTLVVVNEAIPSATVAGRLRSISITEPALCLVSDTEWIVVARTNGVIASLWSWRTTNSGATWTSLGPLGLSKSGGWVSPYLWLSKRHDGTWLHLTVAARRSTSAPPPNQGNLVAYTVPLSTFLADPTSLGTGTAFVIGADYGSTFIRNGYPGFAVDPATNIGMVVWHSETTADNKAKLWWQYVNFNSMITS
jgi:hypothetical protein